MAKVVVKSGTVDKYIINLQDDKLANVVPEDVFQ